MTFRAICVAVALSSVPIAGCGTVANLVGTRPEEGGTTPFGGVRQDVACIKQASSGEFGFKTHPKSDTERYPQTALMLVCAADVPFSFLADFVTWPYTLVFTYINQPIPTPPLTYSTTPVPSPIPPPQMPIPDLPAPRPLPAPPMPVPVPPVPLPAVDVRPPTSP